MRITNKKRRIKRPLASKPNVLFADNNVVTIMRYRDERRDINCIKQKHGINQRWGLLMHIREDGDVRYYKMSKMGKHFFRGTFVDEIADRKFFLEEKE